ncbi:MAG: acyl-CoA thioesterase [Clostridiaceae bacterium]|nr:acyl-CoA thioesterase [Clostridiaceae bacterium]
MEVKTPSQTEITMSELVLPNDTNLLGNLVGGRLMYWIDIAGALVASRHSNKVVATVSIDNITFKHPVRMGEMVIIKAKMLYAGRTSMSISIRVYAENLKTGSTTLTNKARMVFVALDENGNPSPVPPLLPETNEEKADFEKECSIRSKK